MDINRGRSGALAVAVLLMAALSIVLILIGMRFVLPEESEDIAGARFVFSQAYSSEGGAY